MEKDGDGVEAEAKVEEKEHRKIFLRWLEAHSRYSHAVDKEADLRPDVLYVVRYSTRRNSVPMVGEIREVRRQLRRPRPVGEAEI